MSKPNWKYYIDNNDFEGAYDRYLIATKNWKEYWFDVCKQIFEASKEWAKTYVIDPIAKTIQAKVKVPRIKREYDINTNNLDLLDKNDEKCYLFRFFDSQGNRICSKVGTTKREIIKRLKEELNSKTYKDMGAVSATIDRVYNCRKMPAEGLESYFRAEYIKRFPNSFRKNDRFMLVDFDLDEADKIVESYFATV
jgi:hypothetical protein